MTTSQWRAQRGDAANPEARHTGSYPWFDWLRLALAFIVLGEHIGHRVAPFLTGALAVKIFFALSGWLIGGILIRSEKGDLPRFYFNRATRIWIPYGVAVLLLYGTALVREGPSYFWFKYLLFDVTFTHQIYTVFPQAMNELPLSGTGNHFWSIAVEEQFYLVAPLLILFAPWGKSLRLWLPLACLATALNLNSASVSLGVCAAIAQRNHGVARNGMARVAALVTIGATATLMSIGSIGEYIVGPLFAASSIVLLATPGRRTKLGTIAGGISFPLYLNQWIATFLVRFAVKHGLGMADWVAAIAICVVALGVALVLYCLIDRPILKHRNGWFTPRLGRRLGILAYAVVVAGLIAGGLLPLFAHLTEYQK